jgi:hypothetical protein
MTIEKINFSYPKGTLQSVFDTEELTALELASKTSKKVDECIELVNGVEQTAIEATSVVDEMRISQEQFMTENADIRASIITENGAFIDTLETAKTVFETGLNTSKTAFETGLNNSKTAFETNMAESLTDFEAELNTSKTTFETNMTTEVNNIVTNSATIIQNDVNEKITDLLGDGTIETLLNDELLGNVENDVVASELSIVESTGKGIVNGFEVLQQASPDMSVLVSAGTSHLYNGKRYAKLINTPIIINPAHITYPRIDIIYINGLGELTYEAGLASAIPIAPNPANALILAHINIIVGTIAIIANMITDKRLIKRNTEQMTADITNLNKRVDNTYINVKDYGALGNANFLHTDGNYYTDSTHTVLSHDDYINIQNAISAGMTAGKSVYIPAGNYLITQGLLVDNSASIFYKDNKKIDIIGGGLQQTKIIYRETGPALRINGGKSGIGNAMQSYQSIRDFTIWGVDSIVVGSIGLSIDTCQGLKIKDVEIVSFEYGVYALDTDNASFFECILHWNKKCIYMSERSPRVYTSARPNNINFYHCQMGGYEYAGCFVGGTNINFFGGDVQGSGIGGLEANRFGLLFLDGAVQGGVGCNINNVFFESNMNLADIYIWNLTPIAEIPLPTVYNVTGCTFNRTQNQYITDYNILCSFNEALFGQQKLICTGNAFRNFTGQYTPLVTRPHIYFGNDPRSKDNCYFFNNVQSDDIEKVIEDDYFPKPTSVIGEIGEYKQILGVIGGTLELPAGGMWEWNGFWVSNSTGAVFYFGANNAGISAGGTNILGAQVGYIPCATIRRIS